MTLKCTVDGRAEFVGHLIFVCHHCGKPVCDQHGLVVSADDAFDDSDEDSGKRVPQPAMHCKQCADEHHPRAYKHPGWVDPREVPRPAQALAAPAVQQQAGGQPVLPQGQPWGQPPQQQGQQWGQPVQQQDQPWGQPVQQQGQQWGQATGRP
jgi:hypothetical protein